MVGFVSVVRTCTCRDIRQIAQFFEGYPEQYCRDQYYKDKRTSSTLTLSSALLFSQFFSLSLSILPKSCRVQADLTNCTFALHEHASRHSGNTQMWRPIATNRKLPEPWPKGSDQPTARRFRQWARGYTRKTTNHISARFVVTVSS